MYSDEKTRDRIFNSVRSQDDPDVFPSMAHIRDNTPISISSFQVWMSEYLQKIFEWTGGQGRPIPVFYLGDAAGGTDWVGFGASLMRGMRSGSKLADLVTSEGVHGAIKPFQKFWKDVVIFESNKEDPPVNTPELKFKYSKEGRSKRMAMYIL